ncbi:MAG: hypothetical protein Q8M18_19675 [Bradyrhizobium sp.]|nr:hypothetical protein [Bradyrhizobium sp.]
MLRTSDAEYFIQKAEQCFSLARHVRADYANNEIAAELDAIANEFLARAVELDTERDRAETRQRQ